LGALTLKGSIYFQAKDYQGALAAYDEALLIYPQSSDYWISKGEIFVEMKQFQEASVAFREALSINPDIDFLLGNVVQNDLQMCKWDTQSHQIDALVRKVEEGQKAAIPYNFISLLDDRGLIRRSIELYAHSLQGTIQKTIQHRLSRQEKIRIAYFSADFHNHPTAYLIAELFECHDKHKFELIAFVFGKNTADEMRGRLEKSFSQFIDVDALTDEEIAKLSRDMKIDIAVDLKGYTTEARPKIFMYGAAPIQISYLGFPGTMGLSCFDYIVADRIVIPDALNDGVIEKIIYMPNCYQVNDRRRKISTTKPSKKSLGLPDTGFIFCCFNNNYKITPPVMDGWARILNAVPNSILWLFADNPFAMNNLKKEMLSRGVDPERLIFSGRIESADHLARYQLADLFLDTFPCNAHTTASDALWAGLPLVTLIGESFGARVAASLLHAIDLPELIAQTQEEYEQLTIKLAKNASELNRIKEKLLINRYSKPLFDTPLFTEHLENAYFQAYERYHAGLAPENIHV
jgi:tetratricopeptide (TPR) repeat protein